ncbi:MAG: BMP family ABC transporter substrate-binding protein [Lachnospiraceae bacterium]|nr:BMP family ABC transporter substrate-binding protein [Lachnospiraceae bacterium]
MKKKLIAMILAASMVVSLVGCGAAADSSAPAAADAAADGGAGDTSAADTAADTSSSGSTTDVAFVTDVGNIDDGSFNQYTWAGVQQFCADNGLNANYYKPSEDSDAARLEQMDNAIKDGAKVVVMAGYLFAASLGEAQAKHPDTSFLALDVSTGDLEAPEKNTALITYKEEQAGYLAGYAAVTDGYKELGFLGGMAVPAVVRYGYGFVQGAEQAAKDAGVSDVHIKYWYSGSFVATDDIKAKMDSWYSEGTEVVFACGGSICNSCLAAAQANNGKMIGVDVDQSNLDPCVITSAMKALSNSVILALTDAKENNWKFSDKYAGKETTLGAAEDCVGLPMDSSVFSSFTQEQYDKLFASLQDGSLVVDNSFDTAVTPAVSSISVDYQE